MPLLSSWRRYRCSLSGFIEASSIRSAVDLGPSSNFSAILRSTRMGRIKPERLLETMSVHNFKPSFI